MFDDIKLAGLVLHTICYVVKPYNQNGAKNDPKFVSIPPECIAIPQVEHIRCGHSFKN